ncbi:unnamed protein product [Dibothriocephalus latus]|uniref:Uncharacterized protein n=1 Tax=Dibothriocephalus latus TaxID=60516 RepID=A0A3P7PYC4_DIBLA|nr:unnamed protein product [Dibothriocephalus latus]
MLLLLVLGECLKLFLASPEQLDHDHYPVECREVVLATFAVVGPTLGLDFVTACSSGLSKLVFAAPEQLDHDHYPVDRRELVLTTFAAVVLELGVGGVTAWLPEISEFAPCDH